MLPEKEIENAFAQSSTINKMHERSTSTKWRSRRNIIHKAADQTFFVLSTSVKWNKHGHPFLFLHSTEKGKTFAEELYSDYEYVDDYNIIYKSETPKMTILEIKKLILETIYALQINKILLIVKNIQPLEVVSISKESMHSDNIEKIAKKIKSMSASSSQKLELLFFHNKYIYNDVLLRKKMDEIMDKKHFIGSYFSAGFSIIQSFHITSDKIVYYDIYNDERACRQRNTSEQKDYVIEFLKLLNTQYDNPYVMLVADAKGDPNTQSIKNGEWQGVSYFMLSLETLLKNIEKIQDKGYYFYLFDWKKVDEILRFVDLRNIVLIKKSGIQHDDLLLRMQRKYGYSYDHGEHK